MKNNTFEERQNLILQIVVIEGLITRYTLNKQWERRKEAIKDYFAKYDLLMSLERDIENQLEELKKGSV